MPSHVRTLFAMACMLLAGTVLAQGGATGFPSRPVRMVVAFPPGGSNDMMARVVAQRMSQDWGQPVVVENRPGANTIIAAELVAKSAPDGYTVLVGASSTYTVNPAIYAKLPYDPVRDLAPVTLMGSFALVVAVNPDVPANSIRELIALAKSRPGALNYGTPTVTFHVAVESFNQQAGIRMTHIPYKGSVPTIIALIAGDVQFAFMDAAPILPHIKSGKLKALAVTSAKRASYLPDVPTVAESGLPGYEMSFWTGLFAPAGTPREIIGRLQAGVARAMHAPENRERLVGLGIDPVANSPEEFSAYLAAETARYATVIRTANIGAE